MDETHPSCVMNLMEAMKLALLMELEKSLNMGYINENAAFG